MAGSKLLGLINRNGFDATTKTYSNWTHHQMNAILGGVVILGNAVNGGLAWSELQGSAGTGVGTLLASGTKYIDAMFDQADAYNATGPTLYGTSTDYRWTLLMRLFSGEYAPTFAQNYGGGPVTDAGNSSGLWWDSSSSTNYQTAYQNFHTALAKYVPNYTVRSSTSSFGLATGANTQALAGHPLLGQVSYNPTMTKYAETMLKDDFHDTGTGNNGYNLWTPANSTFTTPYTYTRDVNATTGSMSAVVNAWSPTPVAMSHNPYLEILNASPWTQAHQSDMDNCMDSWAGYMTGSNVIVVENNSIYVKANKAGGSGTAGDWGPGTTFANYTDRNAGYTEMYTRMVRYNGMGGAFNDLDTTGHPTPWQLYVTGHQLPMHFQTATYGNMANTASNLTDSLNYCTWLGARSVELPGDGSAYAAYGTEGSAADLSGFAAFVAPLIANDPGGSPPPTASAVTSFRYYNYRH